MTSTPKYGVFHDMPAEEYHRLPGASASILRKFHNSTPAHAKVELEKPREPSVEMMLGTLAHHHLLEPDKPCPKVAIPPAKYPAPANCSLVKQKKVAVGDPVDWAWQANYCKDWKKARREEGMMVVDQDDYDNAIGMVKSILLHPVAAKYFEEGIGELSIIGYEKSVGSILRCRTDWVPRGPDLVDVKTTHDSSERIYQKTAYESGLHIQAALNLDLFNANCGSEDPKAGFVFVVVEQKPPYAVNVFKCSAAFISQGREDYMRLLGVYTECLRTNHWPAYSTEIKTLELPGYVK